jgi:hypothetical protein
MWWPTHKLKLGFPPNCLLDNGLPRAFSNPIVGFVVQDGLAIVDEILWEYIVQPHSIGIDVADEIGIGVEISV